MTDYDLLWKEILDAMQITSDQQPHERTLKQLTKEWNISERSLRNKLDRLMDENKITRRKTVAADGKRCYVYAPVLPENQLKLGVAELTGQVLSQQK